VKHIPFPRQPRKLPVVLSQGEVIRLFDATRSLKLRAILMTAYAAGMRLTELTQLRVSVDGLNGDYHPFDIFHDNASARYCYSHLAEAKKEKKRASYELIFTAQPNNGMQRTRN